MCLRMKDSFFYTVWLTIPWISGPSPKEVTEGRDIKDKAFISVLPVQRENYTRDKLFQYISLDTK